MKERRRIGLLGSTDKGPHREDVRQQIRRLAREGSGVRNGFADGFLGVHSSAQFRATFTEQINKVLVLTELLSFGLSRKCNNFPNTALQPGA